MLIKIITCHYAYNYGAVLQTYALCKYLNDLGNQAEVINYRPWYYKGSTKTTNKLKLLLRKLVRIPDNIKSEKVFYSFLKQYIPMTDEYKTYSDLVEGNLKADLFIAGSDQIWNLNLPNGIDDAFYLKFVNAGKKAAYAASLGMDSITDEQKRYLKKKLAMFDYISVRELSTKIQFDEGNITRAEVVMDPVYLLNREEWITLMKRPKHFLKDKYIMVYAFNRQKEIFDFSKRLGKKYGYKVISVNTFWEDRLWGLDYYYWNCKPEEFLYLLYHAECIVTNSFHGLSFSLIFNKPVILFDKDDKGNLRMNDLINNLGATQVKNKDIKINRVIPTLDYNLINKNIEINCKHSVEYLEMITNGKVKDENSMRSK